MERVRSIRLRRKRAALDKLSIAIWPKNVARSSLVAFETLM